MQKKLKCTFIDSVNTTGSFLTLRFTKGKCTAGFIHLRRNRLHQ